MSTTVQLEKMWRRMQLLIGHGRIQIGDDSGQVQIQQVQFAGDDIRDDTPRITDYGFTSMPKPGCQAIVVFIGGDRSNGAILGTNDDTARLKNLLPGEVAIYDDLGQSVYLTRAGIVVNGGGLPIQVNNTPSLTVNASTSVTLNTPLVHCTQNLTVDGLATVGNLTMTSGGAANFSNSNMNYSACTVSYTGGSIKHNGKVIDSNEVHSGVTSGGSNTGPTA